MRARNGASSASASVAERLPGWLVALRVSRIEERAIERAQPFDQRLPRLAAKTLRTGARDVDLTHHVVDRRVERTIGTGSQRRQTGDDTLEMRGQRLMMPGWRRRLRRSLDRGWTHPRP